MVTAEISILDGWPDLIKNELNVAGAIAMAAEYLLHDDLTPILRGRCGMNTTHTQPTAEDWRALEMFDEIQAALLVSIQARDSIWVNYRFGSLRDEYVAQRKNWFNGWVPSCWGRWPAKERFGPHIELQYDRQDECLRLSIAVEKPIRDEFRDEFKREAVAVVRTARLPFGGVETWPATPRRGKIARLPGIPLNKGAHAAALTQYLSLEPAIADIGQLIREYNARNGFHCAIKFE